MQLVFVIALCSLLPALGAAGGPAMETRITVTKHLPVEGGNDFYVANRPPLLPSPLIKLPLGSITPRGWLRTQLELMRDGMTGHLPELSKYCRPNSGWMDFKSHGWEELPYWLKGFGDLGYVLKDQKIIAEARKWLDATLSHQDADGYFGPPMNREKNDLWPNMVMLFCLQSLYEATGDERVIPFMLKYFRYELELPREQLLPGSWQKIRAGDNLESVYWLYNRTGEKWLLELGQALYERTADWTHTVPTPHVVNICQSFRQPADYYQQSKDPKHLQATERVYATVWGEYGQVPGGMFAGDENYRPGRTGAHQAAETCAMVELMYSFESLLKITGDPLYADRCEEVAFNSLPAAQTPDLKGLHYLTAPNLVQCDAGGSHEFQNQGMMVAFSPWAYRCCQHNVAQGWPYYAEHLWLATQGNGLAAVLYADCKVEARVGNGQTVTISEQTDYPFSGAVNFTLSTAAPVRFPLALRIPRWSKGAAVTLNGKRQQVEAEPLSYVIIERTWHEGDQVRLELPMDVSVTVWKKQQNAVSVSRGPLSYSLKIGEQWIRCGGTDKWPEFEVMPSTPWNYGLVLDPKDPAASFRVTEKGLQPGQPFTPEAAPLELHARGRRIPHWTVVNNTCGELQPSPVKSDQPLEDLTLIPMGCARLRISVFPTIGTGPDAHLWPPPPPRTVGPGQDPAPERNDRGDFNLALLPGNVATASYSWRGDPPRLAIDGALSHQPSPHNRWTCWQSPNKEDWLAVRFTQPQVVRAVGLEIYDDQRGVWPPQAYRIQYWTGDGWADCEEAVYEPEKALGGKENRVTFTQVRTEGLRVVFTHLDPEHHRYSGVTELYIWGDKPAQH